MTLGSEPARAQTIALPVGLTELLEFIALCSFVIFLFVPCQV